MSQIVLPSWKRGLTSDRVIRGRHCLIIADGLYEWKKLVKSGKQKQPYHIRFRDGRLFAFAGLWEEWESPDGPLRSCTMITSEPNYLVKDIHDRLAKIVNAEHEKDWLNPELSPEEALALLVEIPHKDMEAVKVTHDVGNSRIDSAQFIVPIEQDEDAS
ncbi:SOS response-associated peptidase [bacterium]|nr:MAG: SOS response-associated peptidase [bacterium]